MSRSIQDLRVLKHSVASRLLHWCLIFGFLPAAITGFLLWLRPFDGDMMHWAMRVHIAGAVLFSGALLLYTLFCFEKVAIFLRRSFSFGAADWVWMRAGGGYVHRFLGKQEPELPPMGKINSGQKILSVCLVVGGFILLATGWILYLFIPVSPKEFIVWADRLHLIVGVFLGITILGHILLGIYNWEDFKTMFGDGTQALTVAKKHNPVWVNQEIEAVRKVH